MSEKEALSSQARSVFAQEEELEEEVRQIAVPQELRSELIDITKESRKSSMAETPKLGGTKIEFPLGEEEGEGEDWP